MTNFDKKEWKKKFNHYDKNQDGFISVGELERLLQYLGFNPTKQEVQEYMAQLDKNKDDAIEFEEFFEFIQTLKDPSGELYDAFCLHDKNKDGFIDEQELREMFTSGNFDPNEIEGLFKLVDVNKDGKIDYKEFVELFSDQC